MTLFSDEASWVESPIFDFSEFEEDPVILMKIWWDSESHWDGAILQYSTDDGLHVRSIFNLFYSVCHSGIPWVNLMTLGIGTISIR